MDRHVVLFPDGEKAPSFLPGGHPGVRARGGGERPPDRLGRHDGRLPGPPAGAQQGGGAGGLRAGAVRGGPPAAAAAARPYMVVLTKADLLPPLELAQSISLVSMQIEEVRHQAHEELRAKKAAQQQQQSNIVVEVHDGGVTSCHSPAPPSPPSGPANNTTFSTTSDIQAPIEVVPVCARSGAGIQDLWRRLCKVQLP